MLTFYETRWAYASLEKLGTRTWMLLLIRVEKRHRGKGLARELITRILRDADAERITIRLCIPAHTYTYRGDLTPDQLSTWYHTLGFRSRGEYFIRRPRKEKANAH